MSIYMSIYSFYKEKLHADLRTYSELSKAQDSYERKVLKLVDSAPKYDGNPDKVLNGVKLWKHICTSMCRKTSLTRK